MISGFRSLSRSSTAIGDKLFDSEYSAIDWCEPLQMAKEKATAPKSQGGLGALDIKLWLQSQLAAWYQKSIQFTAN